jgi:WD40 repeat protein
LPISSSMLPIPNRAIRLDTADEQQAVVTAIAVDPLGDFVAAAGDDHLIRILSANNLKTVYTLSGHRDMIRTLAFNAQGTRLVSAGNDGQLILWDREDSFSIRQQMQGTPALACVRFSPKSNEIAAVGFNNEVFVIGRGESPQFICDCQDLRSVAYRDDNKILAVAGRSGDLYLFERDSGRMLGDHALHRGRIHDVAFHHQSNDVICVAEDGTATIFDTQARQLKHRVEVTTGKLFAVAVLNSHLIAVAGSDNDIRIVHTDKGQVMKTLDGHTGSVSTLKASGGYLFSGSFDATLRRWAIGDIESAEERIAEKDPSLDR